MTRTERRAEQRRLAKLARKAATATSITPAIQPAPEEKSVASEAQIAANRENSLKSTGPQSEIGRAAVSQNRRVHGLNYNAATFTVLPCESQPDYDLLLSSLIQDRKPEGITESLLVVSMAQHRWLLDRATRLQETCFDHETGQVADQKLFSLYLRYATTHERAFHKCLADLVKLRQVKEKSKIGFESQKRQEERHESRQRLDELKHLTELEGSGSVGVPEPADMEVSERPAIQKAA